MSKAHKSTLRKVFLAWMVVAAVGCGEDDPKETPLPNNENNEPANNENNEPANNENNEPANNAAAVGECQETCAALFERCEAEFGEACQVAEVVEQLPQACNAACEEPEGRAQIGAAGELPCDIVVGLAIDGFGLGDACAGIDACMPLETDYSPGADDTWPACISDEGEYRQIEMTISSIGRIAGFEQIADLLWRGDGAPSSDDFLNSRDIYATGEGLDSRVQRREDEHYPPVSDGMGGTLRCRDEGVPELDPDRCVGPAKILPILNEAFQEGILGNDPEVNAARIEAALLWFFYVSSHKEATTCTGTKKDCDSAYAYYTGGVPREEGLGLAGYVLEVAPDTHDRVWDGILAVRCWRDLDPADEATDLATRDKAITQLDVALMHGVAQVVIDRVLALSEQEGAEADASWAFIRILGSVLLRETAERNSGAAEALEAELAIEDFDPADPPALDLIVDLIREFFPCP